MNREERRRMEREIKKNQRRGFAMKTYDITEKLEFGGNPKMKIKNIEVEVNSDAKSVIQAIVLMEDSDEHVGNIIQAYEILFSEADRKKIDKFNLKSNDFMVILRDAITIASGNDPSEEEGNE